MTTYTVTATVSTASPNDALVRRSVTDHLKAFGATAIPEGAAISGVRLDPAADAKAVLMTAIESLVEAGVDPGVITAVASSLFPSLATA